MKILPNIQLRLGRASVAVLGTHVFTETWDMTPSLIAFSELASVSSEIVAILPYFGNMIWMLLLFPTFSTVYYEIIMSSCNKKQKNEIIFLNCLLFSLAFSIFV